MGANQNGSASAALDALAFCLRHDVRRWAIAQAAVRGHVTLRDVKREWASLSDFNLTHALKTCVDQGVFSRRFIGAGAGPASHGVPTGRRDTEFTLTAAGRQALLDLHALLTPMAAALDTPEVPRETHR